LFYHNLQRLGGKKEQRKRQWVFEVGKAYRQGQMDSTDLRKPVLMGQRTAKTQPVSHHMFHKRFGDWQPVLQVTQKGEIGKASISFSASSGLASIRLAPSHKIHFWRGLNQPVLSTVIL
jgi:hypothetical protein